jgi:hypothetical protein
MMQMVFRKQKSYTTRPTNKENMPPKLGVMHVEPNEALIKKQLKLVSLLQH